MESRPTKGNSTGTQIGGIRRGRGNSTRTQIVAQCSPSASPPILAKRPLPVALRIDHQKYFPDFANINIVFLFALCYTANVVCSLTIEYARISPPFVCLGAASWAIESCFPPRFFLATGNQQLATPSDFMSVSVDSTSVLGRFYVGFTSVFGRFYVGFRSVFSASARLPEMPTTLNTSTYESGTRIPRARKQLFLVEHVIQSRHD